ncbi:MAG: AI-2E family transporter [Anaerolineales bacterium]|jgi:predicted PurR-regulated permease PerM|nr:AI-2E family transporter [Anaerolineales bacterium]
MASHPEWRSNTKYIVAVILLIFGIYLIYLSRSVLPSLIIAALIAFLLRPIIKFFRLKLHLPKPVAIFLAYLLGILLLLLSPLVLVPPIVDTANYLIALDYQELVTGAMLAIENWLLGLRANGISFLGFELQMQGLVDPLLEALRTGSSDLSPQLPSAATIVRSIASVFNVSFGVVGSVSSGLLSAFYLILACVYLSSGGDKLPEKLLNITPAAYRPEIDELTKRIQGVWDAFFRGQVSLMLIIGITVWIGGTILGMPGAAALGMVAGLLEIIPNLGPFLAIIPAIIVALLQGSTYLPVSHLTFALIVVGFYILVQMFENNFIVPKVLGDAVNLHPLLVMTGVLVGASVAGILGALLAAPVLATMREVVSYSLHKMMGQAPFPEPPPMPVKPLFPDLGQLKEKVSGWFMRLRQLFHKKT